jgi:hypothetical protein
MRDTQLTRTRRRWCAPVALIVTLAAGACATVPKAPRTLLDELQAKQRATGQAIAGGFNVLEVMSFDRFEPTANIQLGGKYFRKVQVDGLGRRFIADDTRTLKIFDEAGHVVRTVPGVPHQALELSPDGIHIAIVEPWFTGLWILNSVTGVHIPVASRGLNPSWSPDGSKMVYEEFNDGEARERAVSPHDDRALRVFSLATRDATLFATGNFPSWSPDGRWIAYSSGGHVVLAQADDARRVRRLFRASGFQRTVRWSPDSEYLLFYADEMHFFGRSNCFQEWHYIVYRLRDGAKGAMFDDCRPSPDAFRWILNPNVSPTITDGPRTSPLRALPDLLTELQIKQQTTGSAIAGGINGELQVISFDRPQHTNVVQVGGRRFEFLHINGSGNRFMAVDRADLTIFDADGHALRTVPLVPYQMLELSPDGVHLAVVEPAFKGLSVVNSETRERIPVSVRGFNPTWSPDGSKLAYEELDATESLDRVYKRNDKRKLFIFSLKTLQAAPFTKGTVPSWSPDGRWIAYRLRSHLVLADPDNAANIRLLLGTEKSKGVPRWSPGGEYLLFAASPGRALRSLDSSCPERKEIVVYRLRDARQASVYTVCKGFPFDAFRWVLSPAYVRTP